MFKICILFLGLIFVSGSILADSEDSIYFRPQSYSERQYQYDHFMLHYAGISSAMGLWQGNRYSYMSLRTDAYKGDFKSPQMFGNGSAIAFNTETFIQVDSINTTFYGQFGYNSRKDNKASWNLFHSPAENGSPFFLITPVEGKWESQQYLITGSVSKQVVNERLFFGFYFNYKGDINNRINDVRNNQVKLNIDIAPSVTYSVNDRNNISLAIGYNRNKMEPKPSNYLPRAGDDPNYFLYRNLGLGKIKKVSFSGMYKNTYQYNLMSQWLISGKNSIYSLTYSLSDGHELWESKINIPQTNSFSQLGKYEWLINTAKLAVTNQGRAFKSISALSFSTTDGLAYTYNEDASVFQKAYTYYKLMINMETQVYLQSKYLKSFKPALEFNNISALDLTYGQKAVYSTLIASVDINFLKTKLFKGEIMFLGGAVYNKNINYVHDPVSAKDVLYTTNIAYPTMSYLSSDFIVLSPGINWEKTLKNVLLNFEAGGHLTNPTKINYHNQYTTISESSLFNTIYLNVKLVF